MQNALKRRSLWIITSLLCFIFVADGSARDPDKRRHPKKQTPVASSQTKETIGTLLDKPRDVSVSEASISDLARYVFGQTGVPVVIDRRAFEDIGIDVTSPLINGQFSRLPLRNVLNHLLRPLDAAWVVRDGAIVITTVEEQEMRWETQVYGITDLLSPLSELVPDQTNADSIMDAITNSVTPDDWENLGGGGSIALIREHLVVSQTQANHRRVQQLFAAIRAARKLADAGVDASPAQASVTAADSVCLPIHSALSTLMKVQVPDGALEDLAEAIRESHRIPVALDHRALDDIGLDSTVGISVRVQGVQLKQLLNHALRPLDLSWTVRDGVLVITTPEKMESHNEIRVYPMADLIGSKLPYDELRGDRFPASLDSLYDIVQQTVAPDTWECVGGPGTAVVIDALPLLIVGQSPHVHDRIEQLLHQLRAELHAATEKPPIAPASKGNKETSPVRATTAADPFGGETDDLFGADPFGGGGDDPFGGSGNAAENGPFGESDDDPFGESDDDPFGGGGDDDPFGGGNDDPFGEPSRPQKPALDSMRLVVYFLLQPPAQAKGTRASKPGKANKSSDGGDVSSLGTLPRGILAGGIGTSPMLFGSAVAAAELLPIIQALVEPSSWNRGRGVLAQPLGNRLIIRHEPAVHRKIHQLLARLGVQYTSTALHERSVTMGNWMGGSTLPVVGTGGGFFCVPSE